MRFRLNIPSLLLAFTLLLGVGLTTACEDNMSGKDTEFDNWKSRNDEAFRNITRKARAEIAAAQAKYGDEWEQHTPYRFFQSYMLKDYRQPTYNDSICVEILEKGKSEVSPVYTDTVAVNYLGRLIPSESYAKGKIFDHTGARILAQNIFDPALSEPMKMVVKNTVVGFATAMMHMHPGDRWKVYIPSELGYYATNNVSVPKYSMLTFDLQLVRFYR